MACTQRASLAGDGNTHTAGSCETRRKTPQMLVGKPPHSHDLNGESTRAKFFKTPGNQGVLKFWKFWKFSFDPISSSSRPRRQAFQTLPFSVFVFARERFEVTRQPQILLVRTLVCEFDAMGKEKKLDRKNICVLQLTRVCARPHARIPYRVSASRATPLEQEPFRKFKFCNFFSKFFQIKVF